MRNVLKETQTFNMVRLTDLHLQDKMNHPLYKRLYTILREIISDNLLGIKRKFTQVLTVSQILTPSKTLKASRTML